MSEVRSVEEVKPCPFCGQPPVRAYRTQTTQFGWDAGLGSPGQLTLSWPQIECKPCGVALEHTTEEQAEAAWNRRAS